MYPYSRYTRHLLARAAHVTAVDFMESFIEKNRQDNGHHSNATFIQADVTKLDVPRNRCVLSYQCNVLCNIVHRYLFWIKPLLQYV